MLSGRELRGLIVYAGLQREVAGRVRDVYVEEPSGAILGLAIEATGLRPRSLYVELAAVQEISKNGVIGPNKKSLKSPPKGLESVSQKGWLGSRLLDERGQDKGTVADILVKNGRISGLEISAGILSDLQSRRDFLPWEQVSAGEGIFTLS